MQQIIVLIWKMWDPDQPNEPEKTVDKRRITDSKQKKYNNTKITNRLNVTKQWSQLVTSKATKKEY